MDSSIVKATPERIESVRNRIEEIKKGIAGRFLDLGEILAEVRDGGYHLAWGFKNFGSWLEQSGLDLSERAAYYLIKIIETSRKLEIPREKLEKVKLSKLKEIVGLDPDKHADKIRQLVDACIPSEDRPEMSLEDVRVNVQKVRDGKEEIDTFVFITIKVTKQCKEEVIGPAIEMARAEHGDSVDSTGESIEISPGRAIELICADYLAGVHGEEEVELDHSTHDAAFGGSPLVPTQKALPPVPVQVAGAVPVQASNDVVEVFSELLNVISQPILEEPITVTSEAIPVQDESAQCAAPTTEEEASVEGNGLVEGVIEEVKEKIAKGRARRAKMLEDEMPCEGASTLPDPTKSPFAPGNFESWFPKKEEK